MQKFLCFILCLSFFYVSSAQEIRSTDPSDVWAGEQLKAMSVAEKIGQVFMIRAHSDLGKKHEKEIADQIKKYKPGGLCFFQGDPETQATLINQYQSISDVSLMIAMDAEWGLGMRFPEEAQSFPKQLTLGAIEDNDLIYEMSAEIARQLKRIGVHVNFAPVVDINNNPSNPVIGNRSYGEDIFNVTSKSYAYMKGLQENGVLACAKHFPGHGDTNVDSHYDLPVIKHSRQRLDSVEMKPFKVLSELGLGSVMVAHLSVPSLDDRPNRATTLSAKTVNDILKKEIGFDGLIVTDALEMQGVAKHFKTGVMEVEAFLAGNDVLLMPIDFKIAFEAMEKAVEDGVISTDRLDHSVFKILKAKYSLGLQEEQKVKNISSIMDDVMTNEAIALEEKLYEQSLTLVRDNRKTIPIKQMNDRRFASLSLGGEKDNVFQNRLQSYSTVDAFHLGKTISAEEKRKTLASLEDYDVVFVSIHDMSRFESKKFGLTQDQLHLIYDLNARTNIVLTLFGSPYALRYFSTLPTIMVAYEENDISMNIAAQGLFGVFSIKGKLPITAHEAFPFGSQVITSNLQRLGYSVPERVGMNSDTLAKIADIAKEMMDKKAAPGCQVLVAKEGKIVYQESFGYHDYSKQRAVENHHLYDVASVTKILSTTISLMSLQDKGQFNPRVPLANYLPDLNGTNKASLLGDEVLAHHARLAAWIPFYKKTLTDDKKPKINPDYYRTTKSDSFNIAINESLFLRFDYQDSIYQRIYDSELKKKKEYKYSDLGFYMFEKIIEKSTDFTLDKYAHWKFYKPLDLKRTLYNPLNRFSLDEIVPSEVDQYFRQDTIHGRVHDMGAAMLGGVAGHAGLFSNAGDLSILMQMLLNGGSYGGYQYLKPETIQIYTRRYASSNRRALGFDMKQLNEKKTANVADEVSELAFGHLGFTGTSVFADPKHDLVFIFLSNRTFPTMDNKVFNRKNYRPRIQSVVYRSIEAYQNQAKLSSQ